ncbi:hypothetical protein A3C23_05230 [Candidatus Roizmanbacteria bacterium RIFCSPHIGHO2_02_FULL_37_13b]|uniref:Uncharacterized protein n=1 Tax=Candidatus Roizmanbacteria bacterium RIFCSPLOWO2_02_FULL_36_11 TaxID=1802071 RepID=A0A1F7JCL8_9BACT|nr:MAG: hypothetical protein A3C23_05230 [Candidatus Roizmanbacteria bacterium RIFCSPHIGHO2_02_FULL_37_13b]OGK53352.1 MAG: hypothetical protein A3H78_03560 [Candidatus Roizmanbacteria bacterium RIFCSPLOWO2_02_FULL_36_11]
MAEETPGIMPPDLILEHATNFPIELRQRIAAATRIYTTVQAETSDMPFAHAYIDRLAREASTPTTDVINLGMLLQQFPQLSFDTTVDLGQGAVVALPLDLIYQRQQKKIDYARSVKDQTGIDVDAQAAEVREKARSVLDELGDAVDKEGIPMRLHVYKALQDAGFIEKPPQAPETPTEGTPPKGTPPEAANPWWDTIIPNYVTGLTLVRIGNERIAETAAKN